jgi:hypothetical protein
LPSYAGKQDKDEILRGVCLYLLNKSLPANGTLAQLIYGMSQDCFALNGGIWKHLGANHQHHSVPLMTQHLILTILHEAH